MHVAIPASLLVFAGSVFRYEANLPAVVRDIVVTRPLDGYTGQNPSHVVVEGTWFSAHANAIGLLAGSDTSPWPGAIIQMANCAFEGRALGGAVPPAPALSPVGGAVRLDDSSPLQVEARNCWWGDAGGPFCPSNTNAPGAYASPDVAVSPWLAVPPAAPPP